MPHGCPNALKVSRKLVEALLLASIQRDVFTPDGIALFKQEFVRELAEQRRTQKLDQAQAHVRLPQVEREIANITDAIKQGILTISTKAELEKAEAEWARLLQTVQAPKKLDRVTSFIPDMTQRFKRLVDVLATVTQHQVDKARGILRELVGGQIRFQPAADGTERFLMVELTRDYAGLMRLVCGSKIKLVAVTRIERVTRGL